MNVSQVILSPVFPWWIILTLSALVLAFTFLQLRAARKRLGGRRSAGLFLLRLAAIFLLIALALNPTWLTRKEVRVFPSLALLLDTSPGMGLPGRDGEGTRLDEARALLLGGSNPLLKQLAGRFDLRIYELGDPLRALKPEELPGLAVREKKSDLTAGLNQLAGKTSLAVVVSDGNMTAGESGPKGLPVLTVPVGDSAGYKDVFIKDAKAPAMAFRGREVGFEVTVKGYGYPGLKIPVILKNGEKVLRARDVRLNERTGEGVVSLSFTPEQTGLLQLSVSVPKQFGEVLTSNNTASLPLNVVRDKIRVLMVTGSPSMSYRYLRTALKNDPSIDLLSFIILRLPSNILNVPLQEQSLIPFPVETLFTKDLKDFDLLLFDNFQSALFLKAQYLENVRDFVKAGGAFGVIGGPNFSGEGGYAGTALEEVLPVRWAGKESYRRDLRLGVRLSRAGKVHPITRFSPVDAENLSLWPEMAPLDGINPVRPKSSATVLLESAGENAWPILVAGTYGKGRVLVLATDYSWKWYMGMVAQGKGNWAYFRLVERMVRWATKDPALEPIQINFPEAGKGALGGEKELRVRVREDTVSSRTGGGVSATVRNPEGKTIRSVMKPAGPEGEYLLSFVPEKEGVYRVKVETRAGSREEPVVIGGAPGNGDGFPDHDRLKRIAESSRGKTAAGGEELLKELSAYAESSQNRFVEESRRPLMANAYVLVVLIGLLSLEWYLRRRWGLI